MMIKVPPSLMLVLVMVSIKLAHIIYVIKIIK